VGVGVLVRLELCDFNELDVELDMPDTVRNVLTEFRSLEYRLKIRDKVNLFVALYEVNSRNCLVQKLAMKPENRLLVDMIVLARMIKLITHQSVTTRGLRTSGHEAKLAQLTPY
jgi:hypothetical protein